VLLHAEDEVYFSLSDVASRIWRLLPVSSSFDELCLSLQRQFPDVPSQIIRKDASELLTELIANRLVTPPADAPPTGSIA